MNDDFCTDRQHMEEVRDDMKADRFFRTSRVVLRSAFHRFQDAIRYQRHIAQASAYIQSSLFRRRFLRAVFLSWRRQFGLKLLSQRSLELRNSEILRLSFARWQMLTEVEKLHTLSRNQRLVAKVFKQWVQAVSDQRKRVQDDEKVEWIRKRMLLRQVFSKWRQQVDYFDGDDSQLNHVECKIVQLRVKRILRRWYESAERKTERSELLSNQISVVQRKYVFHAWRKLSQSRWSQRGVLMKQFYEILRRKVELRKQSQTSTQVARFFHLQYSCRHVFRVLSDRVQQRLSLQLKLQKSLQSEDAYATHGHEMNVMRQVRDCFYHWIRHVDQLRRDRSAAQTAILYAHQSLPHRMLRRWYNRVHFNRHALVYATRYLLGNYLRNWRSLVPTLKINNRRDIKIEQLFRIKIFQRAKKLFQTWHQFSRRQRQIHSKFQFIRSKHNSQQVLGKSFRVWLNLWGMHTLQKGKYLQAENKDVYMLSHLKVLELQDLEIQLTQVNFLELYILIRQRHIFYFYFYFYFYRI